ncbi:hypothetical protein ACGFZH_28115 [Streptomyces zaomyceticus]|uniref:hypothetical protein n=1 Tax=Streptomyces zaomyceticus TaxID=68286 RepID=UPI003712B219
MTGSRQQVAGALFIDCGKQLKNGTWVQPPRARYECLTCRTTEGPVVGAAAVTAFVQTIRAKHQHHNQQGAPAA